MPYRSAAFASSFSARAAWRLSAIALAVFVAGCAVGPDYQRPTVSVPATYKEAPEGWKVAQPNDQADRGS